MNDFWQWADKYGFPAATLVVVCFSLGWFFIKRLWPMMIKQSDEARTRLDEQTERAEKRFDGATSSFLNALEQQRKTQVDSFEKLTKEMQEQRKMEYEIFSNLGKMITERFDRLERLQP